jgi:hypothetical protein
MCKTSSNGTRKERHMTAPQPLRSSAPASRAGHERVIDLGGQAVHVFQFDQPVPVAYEYFLDVPAVFRLLPDVLDVKPYAEDHHRLVVGASDGYGHTMAAVFDVQVVCEEGRLIRVAPVSNGPPINLGGLVFRGDLWADAEFASCSHGSNVQYAVEIALSIPIPPMLRMMPLGVLQGIGEKGMALKMSQMINGFTRRIKQDFYSWSHSTN